MIAKLAAVGVAMGLALGMSANNDVVKSFHPQLHPVYPPAVSAPTPTKQEYHPLPVDTAPDEQPVSDFCAKNPTIVNCGQELL